MGEPIFLYNSDPHHLVSSFIGTVEGLAYQGKAEMKSFFHVIETTIKIKLGRIMKKLTQRHNRRQQVRRFDMNQDACENKNCAFPQFLQIQTNQLIELREELQRYCDVKLAFGFNSAKYYLNLIKAYLLPILVNERNIEPTVIMKANQFISFKLGDIQLLVGVNLLGGATSLLSILKAYKL